jgi:hypothetical protein
MEFRKARPPFLVSPKRRLIEKKISEVIIYFIVTIKICYHDLGPEAEFLNEIQTKVLRGLLRAIQSPPTVLP